MVLMPEIMYGRQLAKYNESESCLKRLLDNKEFINKMCLVESKTKTISTLDKFKALWDE